MGGLWGVYMGGVCLMEVYIWDVCIGGVYRGGGVSMCIYGGV